MVRLLAFGLAALLAGCAAAAERSEPGEARRRLVEETRRVHGLPALAAAVVRPDTLELHVTGRRALDREDPVQPEDAWALGSCTKAMTATVLAVQVEEGRLSWSATLDELLPDLAPDMHAGFRGATLQQLVDHRAGLAEDHTTGGVRAWLRGARSSPTEQRAELARRVLTRPPAYPPGSERRYANAGYLIAAAAAEHALATDFDTLMRRTLFEPLGMRDADFGAPSACRGHHDGEPPRPVAPDNPLHHPPPVYHPSGGVHASLADWAAFARVHLGDGDLLSPAALAELHAAEPGRTYRAGFVHGVIPGSEAAALVHHGASALWFSSMWIVPEHGLAVLVACNVGGERGERACRELAERVLADLLPPP